MKQTRTEKQIIYRAVQDLLCPVVSPSTPIPLLGNIAGPTVMSGITAMMILDAMTFGHMRLDWEAEDEVRSMMKRSDPADNEDNPSRLRIAEVANIWSKRLSEAYIGFSCPTPSELSVLHKKITDIGVYLGCDSDIEALFRGVPADDINP